MDKELIYNQNRINILEDKIENILKEVKINSLDFYKKISKKEKESRILKNISNVLLSISFITLIVSLVIMSFGIVNAPILITTLVLIFLSLDIHKDAIEKRKNINKEKEEFELSMNKYRKEIEKTEEKIEIRDILKDCIESNFIKIEDQKKIKQKILMNDLSDEFTNLEMTIFYIKPKDDEIKLLDNKKNITIEELKEIKNSIIQNEITGYNKYKKFLKKK